MPKPFSDEELKEWRKQPAHGDEKRFLATIAADQQQIENLKLDLHIANRALEIDPATVDLRKRIAELELECLVHKTDYQHSHAMRMAERKQIAELEAEVKEWQDIVKERDKLIEGWNRDYKKAEAEFRAENQRLRDQMDYYGMTIKWRLECGIKLYNSDKENALAYFEKCVQLALELRQQALHPKEEEKWIPK